MTLGDIHFTQYWRPGLDSHFRSILRNNGTARGTCSSHAPDSSDGINAKAC